MRKTMLVGMLVAAVLTVSASRARACGQSHDYTALYMALFVAPAASGAIDISFTIHDLAVDKSSVGASAAELILTAPQVAFGLWVTANVNNTGDKALFLLLSAWPAALSVHAIYSLVNATPDGTPEPPPRQASAFRLVPSAVSDGTNVAPGLFAVGRF
jgi:hypothetical protein